VLRATRRTQEGRANSGWCEGFQLLKESNPSVSFYHVS
jgi:hypothetical protein